MSTERINGMAFDVTIGGHTVHVKSANLDITDNSKVTQTRGVPDGWCRGDVAAEGEIEVDTLNFKIFKDIAAEKGAWRDIPESDFLFYAKAGDSEIKVEAFGCKITLSNVLSIDSKGGEASTHKLKYQVTSPDFVKIDGIPVLTSEDVRDLMG